MTTTQPHIAFIGGGNMASAIIGGLLRQGTPVADITVLEPFAETAARLRTDFGVNVLAQAQPDLAQADLVVWAVKPQVFREAAQPVQSHTTGALHLSVAAGIRTDSLCQWLGSQRVVRCMPNTPALVRQGITGLYACPGVSADEQRLVERVIATTGQYLWVEHEPLLDAVTALSGSGPAYVFLFLEAMRTAGEQMGLSAEQAYRLALATFSGAASLAANSHEPPQVLRQRVTSKGGTTHAAISAMQTAGLPEAFIAAMHAARQRAQALGDEFGA